MAASAAAASEGPRCTLCVRGGSERGKNKTGGLFRHPVKVGGAHAPTEEM